MSLNSDGTTVNVAMSLYPVPQWDIVTWLRTPISPLWHEAFNNTSKVPTFGFDDIRELLVNTLRGSLTPMNFTPLKLELRRQCQKFAVDLLHQSRSSQELAIILNHDPESPSYEDGEHMKLARLELAINYSTHPNIQQLLAALWYEGLPGFRRKPMLQKCLDVSQVALLFPFYCMLYMVAPNTATGKLMRKPFMKFLIHASSYLFFLREFMSTSVYTAF
uniref:Uncharacterized protein n=1 Tax=Timema poppense TaxID=170557 RepID=A0A7R9HCR3_TIMPO|nr:unnamed protein product [Timema poppensis]